jgi:hypothetical protein
LVGGWFRRAISPPASHSRASAGPGRTGIAINACRHHHGTTTRRRRSSSLQAPLALDWTRRRRVLEGFSPRSQSEGDCVKTPCPENRYALECPPRAFYFSRGCFDGRFRRVFHPFRSFHTVSEALGMHVCGETLFRWQAVCAPGTPFHGQSAPASSTVGEFAAVTGSMSLSVPIL